MTQLSRGATEFLHEVLDAIERHEARLLVWGLVDGRLNPDELRNLIEPLLENALLGGVTGFIDTADVIKTLQGRALLFPTDDLPFPGYRSRMAETVRLLFRLRQLFFRHDGPDRWIQAPTLVSDFRFLWRRRSYPRRDCDAAAAMTSLTAVWGDAQGRAALQALLDARGPDFRLASFQVRAAERIAVSLGARQKTGTLVSAGTGSGKTLAFYLPAIGRITSHVMRDPSPWVKALALYPRNELLRDQFAEIYQECRHLDGLLQRAGRRPLRIGCLFGGTPDRPTSLDSRRLPAGWRRTNDGVVCSYMRCPGDNCSGELVWRDEDRRARPVRERLLCQACGTVVEGEMVALTRDSMRKAPPDIVFSTTEMLNQRMADDSLRHLFGLPPQAVRPVEVMLLDEVHYYTGTTGAQVAYLLRRWQHLLRAPVSFVGLSATVRDGAAFFARLIGVQEQHVAEIAPLVQSEMVEEGAEHLIALRGDPVSRTSLLSTTIQTAMLMMRALDHGLNRISEGLYGLRTFAFTDNLDVINRLYFSLLDAEGRNNRGDPDLARHPQGPLAVLRRPLLSRGRERYGQNWGMPEAVGHHLDERKSVGRTSSQDPGVASNADVIVATASLEVGFNDPYVGAVIQHKAPRSAAQFLQRKGRAGRRRGMRPWTAIILSDYGRDRLAYQAYERLFDPVLPPQSLPVASRHIRRIQSVYALIDYLGLNGPDGRSRGHTWGNLAGSIFDRPHVTDRQWASWDERRTFLIRRLVAMLESEPETEALANHLAQALQLPIEDIAPLLWEHPRPLLTAAIPTALRRLSTNWRRGEEDRGDYRQGNSPLPEFAPGQLFGDLNTPEVQVVVPPVPPETEPSVEAMSIAPALREFTPGRVSRRFATGHGWVRHWIGPQTVPVAGDAVIELETVYEVQEIGRWDQWRGGAVASLPVFRPYLMRPVFPHRTVRDTSNAEPVWSTQIVARTRGLPQEPPRGTPWGPLVEVMESFLHAEQSAIEYRRFTCASRADVQMEGQIGARIRFGFQHDGEEAALGFSVTCDALRFRLRLPVAIHGRLTATSGPMWRALRTARFFDLAQSSETLGLVENPFARRWLAEILLTAITFDAMSRNISLEEANAAVAAGNSTLPIGDVLRAFFQSAPDDDLVAQNLGTQATDRLRQDLDGFIKRADVRDALHRHARLLWEEPDENWEGWLRQRFKSTFGAAALEAIRNLCPDIGEDGLTVDIDSGPRSFGDVLPHDEAADEVWIAETSPGGIGLIETFLTAYAEDPRRFYLLMASALRATEHELVDHQLFRFLEVLDDGSMPDLSESISAYRFGASNESANDAMARLRHALREHGFALFHGYVSALANRVLRPGTSDISDGLLLNAMQVWDAAEIRLGIEIDPAAVAYGLSQDDAIDTVMTAVGLEPPADNLSAWRHNAIYSLLWPRGARVRRGALGLYNPYARLPDPERLLLAEYLHEGSVQIDLLDTNWREQVLARLSESGTVTAICPVNRSHRLAEAQNFLAINPVMSDYLSVYARLATLRRVRDTFEADFELAEFGQ
jgi:hypothetical protein